MWLNGLSWLALLKTMLNGLSWLALLKTMHFERSNNNGKK